MKQLMRYTIKAGVVTEVRDILMDVSPSPRPRKKRGRYTGKSKASQIERNLRESAMQLARIINGNFGPGDLWLTWRYDDTRLPGDHDSAEHEALLAIRRLSRAYERVYGRKLLWVLVTADVSAKTGEPVRLHHHLVVPNMDWALLAKVWPADQMSVRHLDGRRDYTDVARYMCRNVSRKPRRNAWHASRGMKKPVYSPPVPVARVGSARLPRGAIVMEREVHESETDGFRAGYLRYIRPPEEGKITLRGEARVGDAV